MLEIVLAVSLYLIVYGIDYSLFRYLKSDYHYVSRRTYALFLGGQIITIGLFFNTLSTFFDMLWLEILLLALMWAVLLATVYVFHVEHYPVCAIGSRTDRCLTPGYVFVRGVDVVFQQLIYAVIALNLAALFGNNDLVYLAFVLLVMLIHTPVLLSMGNLSGQVLTFGIGAIAIPSFYTFTELGLFWPAVYLHTLVLFFYWITFSDYGLVGNSG